MLRTQSSQIPATDFDGFFASLNGEKTPAKRLARRSFAQTYLKHHVPLPFGEHHEDFFENGGFKLEAIAAPRGSAKTTFFTLIDVIYAICYRLQEFIIIISEIKSLAVERLMDVRAELEMNEKIIADFGSLVGTNWRQDDIICSNGVRVTAKGRGGQIRGSKHRAARPSLIILDDVESSDSVLSPLQREKVANWYATDVRRAGRPDGSTKFRIVGTFLHPDALLPQLTENPSYHSKIYKAVQAWASRDDLWQEWTAKYTDLTNPNRIADARTFYEENESAMLDGVKLLWPDGIDYYTVMEAIVSEGRYAALKEYQNEMLDTAQFLFDMGNAVRCRVEANGVMRRVRDGDFYRDDRFVKWENFSGASIWLDWAGGKDSVDNSFACAVLVAWEKFPMASQAYAYVLGVWIQRAPIEKQIEAAFDLRCEWGRLPQYRFGFEDVPSDTTGVIKDGIRKMFAEVRERRRKSGEPADLQLKFEHQNQNKLDRILTGLQAPISNGWLAFNESLPREYMDQMTQFPTHGFVDAPDATESALRLKPGRITFNEKPKTNADYRVSLRGRR